MFYNARFYDPYLNRFIQADKVTPAGVQGLDRYAYANNDPTTYTDPTGHKNCLEDDFNCPGSPGAPSAGDGTSLSSGHQKRIGGFNPDYQPGELADKAPDIYQGGGFDLGDSYSKFWHDAIWGKDPTVAVYANYNQNSDGSINVIGITVSNQSATKLFISSVIFNSKMTPSYLATCGMCVNGSQTYGVSPSKIAEAGTAGAEYLGTIGPKSTGILSVNPSGIASNETNHFGPPIQQTANVIIQFNWTGGLRVVGGNLFP